MHDDQWHFFSLKIQNNRVNLSIDSELENEIFETKSKMYQNNHKEITDGIKEFILIGGGTNDENGSNFVGSLQQIFINKFDVIQSLQD